MPGPAVMPAGGLGDARAGAQVLGDDRLPLARLAALRPYRDRRRAGEREDLALNGVVIIGRLVAIDRDL